MVVEGVRVLSPVSPLPREGSADTIQIRCLINNVPFRSSSSYASTYNSEGRVFLKLSNIFSVPLLSKNYNVTIQWKKTGTSISKWVLTSGGNDQSFAFYAMADFANVFNLQESSDAVISTPNVWKNLGGNLSVSLPIDTRVTINYALVVQPQLAVIIKDRSVDFVTVRVIVDGLAYTESAETFGTNAWNPLANSMFNSFRLNLPVGTHTISLQWRKMGSTFKNWISSPSFLDGFASARNIIVTVDKMQPASSPVLISHSREILPPTSSKQQLPGTWTTISSSVLQFNLIKESAVIINYALPVTQYENPNVDANLWNTLSSVQARLVIDGVGYTMGSGNTLITGSARLDTLFGQFATVLSAGSHNVLLQWRSDLVKWGTINELEDGYAHSERLLTFISSENAEPTISAPTTIPGVENEDMIISSIGISDIDEALLPGMSVNLNISVITGTLSFPNQPILANFIEYVHADTSLIIFRDTIENINQALSGMVYHVPQYWYGLDTLTFTLSDLDNVGFGGVQYDSATVQIQIAAVNLPFTFSVPPRLQFNFVSSADLSHVSFPITPIAFNDPDTFESTYAFTLTTSCGRLDINSTGFNIDGQFSEPLSILKPSNFLSFSGEYHLMKDVLENRLVYIPDTTCSNFIHGELLLANLTDLVTSQTATKYIAVELLRDRTPAELTTITFPRYFMDGVTDITNIEVNTGYHFNTTRMYENDRNRILATNIAASDITFWNEGSHANESELILVENRFMEYAFTLQYNPSTRIELLSVPYLVAGINSSVEFSVSSSEDIALGGIFTCKINDVMIPATLQQDNQFKCNYIAEDPIDDNGNRRPLWLKFFWYTEEDVMLESNFLPLYVIPEIQITSVLPLTVLSSSLSLLTIEVNQPNLIKSCVFDQDISVPVHINEARMIQCQVPLINPQQHSFQISLETIIANYFTNQLTVKVFQNPILSSASIEASDLENTLSLGLRGSWDEGMFGEVSSINCVFDGYVVPVTFQADDLIYCKLSLGKNDVQHCCDHPEQCMASLLIDNFQTSSIPSSCALRGVLSASASEDATSVIPAKELAFSQDYLKFYYLNDQKDDELVGSLCRFPNNEVSPVYLIDDTSYGCILPTGATNLLSVSTGTGKNLLAAELSIDALPSFYYSSPSSGPSNGGTFVVLSTISDSLPEGRYSCLFADRQINATKLNDTSIGCFSPAGVSGDVSLRVVFNQIFLSMNALLFTYTSPVRVSRLIPSAGSLAGNQLVTLVGEGFNALKDIPNEYCVFGTIPSAVTVVSDTQATCLTPYVKEAAILNVYLQVPNTVHIDTGLSFTYLSGDFLVSVVPNVVSTQISTEITISGSGFVNVQPVYCSFSGKTVPAIVVDSSTISCFTPTLSAGAVALKVISHESSEASNSLTLTAVDPVTVTDLSPKIAIAGKLNKFKLSISSIQTEDSQSLFCSFGMTIGVPYLTPDQNLICEVFVPVNEEVQGDFHLAVGGVSANFVNPNVTIMAIFPAPEIIGLNPLIGSYQGGEILNFTCPSCAPIYQAKDVNLFCRFGIYLTTAMMQANQREFSCFTPAVEQPVTEPFGVLINELPIESGWNFTFVQTPEALQLSPSSSSSRGNQEIYLFGFNFPSNVPVSCIFDGVTVRGQYLNTSALRCISPAHDAGVVSIGVVIGGYVIPSALSFQYESAPAVEVVSSSWIVSSLPRRVEFAGSGFRMEDSYSCLLNDQHVDADYQSDSIVSCVLMYPDQGSYSLRLFSEMHGVVYELDNFSVLSSVRLTSISPITGSEDQPTVTIVGEGFENLRNVSGLLGLQCSFGDVAVTAIAAGNSSVLCPVPSSISSGSIAVTILLGNSTVSENSLDFEFIPAVEIYGFSPSQGNRADGTIVTIQGANLCDESILCVFGDQVTSPLSSDCSTVRCVPPAPAAGQSGFVSIGVNVKNATFLSNDLFLLNSSFVLTSIEPTTAMISGSTGISVSLTINGSLPSSIDSLSCSYANQVLPAEILDDLTISCFLPSPSLRTLPISLNINGVNYANPRVTFTAFAQPIFSDVSTTLLPSNLVGQLTFHGIFSFQNQSVACFIANLSFPATLSATNQIACSLDQQVASLFGSYAFGVIVANRWQTTYSENITITTPVSIDSVNKLVMSSADQSTSLILSGSNFQQELPYQCQLGNVTAGARWIDETSIECFFSHLMVGDYQLQLRIAGGFLMSSSQIIHVQDFGTVLDFSPKVGYANGQTFIQVTGTNFLEHDEFRCFFDDFESDGFYVNASTIVCLTPPHIPAKVSFSVFVNDLPLSMNQLNETSFDFLAPPVISSLFPSTLSYEGFDQLRIIGDNFLIDEGLECVFPNNISTNAQVLQVNELSCVVPVLNATGPTPVYVRYNAEPFRTDELLLNVVEIIEIDNVQGNFYPEAEKIVVYVVGKHFPVGYSVVCAVGDNNVTGIILSETQITCAFSSLDRLDAGAFFSFNFEGYVVTTSLGAQSLTQPVVLDASPKLLPNTIEAEILVTGSNFNVFDTPRCWFGNIATTGIVQDDQSLKCYSPAFLLQGEVPFSVEISTAERSTPISLSFVNPPTVQNVLLSSSSSQSMTFSVSGSGFLSNLLIGCHLDGVNHASLTILNDQIAVCAFEWTKDVIPGTSVQVVLTDFDTTLFEQDLSSVVVIQASSIYAIDKHFPSKQQVVLSFLANTSAIPNDVHCSYQGIQYDLVKTNDQMIQCSIWSGAFDDQQIIRTVILASDIAGTLQTFHYAVLPDIRVTGVSSSWNGNTADLTVSVNNWQNIDVSALSLSWKCFVNSIAYPAFFVDGAVVDCQIPGISLCSADFLQVGYDELSSGWSSPWSIDKETVCSGFVEDTGVSVDASSFLFYNQSFFYPISRKLQLLSKQYSIAAATPQNYELDKSDHLTVVGSDISTTSMLAPDFLEYQCVANNYQCLIPNARLVNQSQPSPRSPNTQADASLLPGLGPVIVDNVNPKIVSDINETWVTVSGRNFNFDAKCVLNDQTEVLSLVISSSTMNCLVPPMTRSSSVSLKLSVVSPSIKNSTSNFNSVTLFYDFVFRVQYKKADLSVFSNLFAATQDSSSSLLPSTAILMGSDAVCLSKSGCSSGPSMDQSDQHPSINPWTTTVMKSMNISQNNTSSFFSAVNNSAKSDAVPPVDLPTEQEPLQVFTASPSECQYPCSDQWILLRGSGFSQFSSFCAEVVGVTAVQTDCQSSIEDSSTLFCLFPSALPPRNYSVNILANCVQSVFNMSVAVTLANVSEVAALAPRSIDTWKPENVSLPQITYIFPQFGWVEGGSTIRLTGNNINENILYCALDIQDDTTASGKGLILTNATVDVDNQRVYCAIPPVGKASTAWISVVLNDGSTVQTGFQYKFTTSPLLYHAQLSVLGNNSIEVLGSGFQAFRHVFCKVFYQDNSSTLTTGIIYSETELFCNQVSIKSWYYINSLAISFNGLDFSAPVRLESPLSSPSLPMKNVDDNEEMMLSEKSISPVPVKAIENELTTLQINQLNPPTLVLNCSKSNLIPFHLDNILQLDTNYSCSIDNQTTLLSKLELDHQRLCFIDPQAPGTHEVVLSSVHYLHAPIRTIILCEADPKIFSVSLQPLNEDNDQQLSTFSFNGFNFKDSLKLECQLNDEIVPLVVDNSNTAFCTFNYLVPGRSAELKVLYTNRIVFDLQFCLSSAVWMNGGVLSQSLDYDQCEFVDIEPTIPEIKAVSYFIRSVFPSSGIFMGNTVIKILADQISYDDSLVCDFGNVSTPALVAGNDYLLCKTPPQPAGSVVVRLHSLDRLKEWCCGTFYYHPFLIIDDFQPKSITGQEGSIALLTIQKMPELSNNLYCHVNGMVATGVFFNENQFSCALPAIYAPIANISLGSLDEIWSNTVQLVVTRPTGIFTISPISGSIFGNSTVTISLPKGTIMASVPFCVFNNRVKVPATYDSAAHTVRCRTPSVNSPIKVPLEIVDGDSPFAAVYYVGEYQFDYPAESLTISPPSASRDLDLSLRVFGANFIDSSALSCFVQNDIVLPAKWFSENLVMCFIPKNILVSREFITVEVSNNGQDHQISSPAPLVVSLTNNVLITDYSPSSGFTLGGDEIVISLKYNVSVELSCDFDGLRIPTFPVTSNMIVCTAPSHQPGPLRVNLVDHSGIAYDSLEYMYYDLPVLYRPATNAILRNLPSSIGFTGDNIHEHLSGKLVDNQGNLVTDACHGQSDGIFLCENMVYLGEDDLLSLCSQ
jgi:hypothetical protein